MFTTGAGGTGRGEPGSASAPGWPPATAVPQRTEEVSGGTPRKPTGLRWAVVREGLLSSSPPSNPTGQAPSREQAAYANWKPDRFNQEMAHKAKGSQGAG